MERLAQRTDERINRLAEQQERTQTQLDQLSGKVDQLSENVDIAFQTITLLSNIQIALWLSTLHPASGQDFGLPAA